MKLDYLQFMTTNWIHSFFRSFRPMTTSVPICPRPFLQAKELKPTRRISMFPSMFSIPMITAFLIAGLGVASVLSVMATLLVFLTARAF